MDKIVGLPKVNKPLYDNSSENITKVLTIAGSDSGGGAGIQADLKTFTSLGAFGTSAITALTSQNTKGVNGVLGINTEFIKSQIKDVVTDIGVDGIKTGMLHSGNVIEAVVEEVKELKVTSPIVVDPVMVSTSGHRLLDEDALMSLKEDLLPIAHTITPNIPEMELLTNSKITCINDIMKVVKMLNVDNTLVKGGHLPFNINQLKEFINNNKNNSNLSIFSDEIDAIILNDYASQIENNNVDKKYVIDVLYQKSKDIYCVYIQPIIKSTSTHGTGCTLSAALCTYLGQGKDISIATQLAIEYTKKGIQFANPIGKGNGPLNHMHSIKTLPISPPTKSDPYPFTKYLLKNAGKHWDDYINHTFVKMLGDGTLPKDCFLHYIRQDYIYLIHYARIHSLAGYKSNSFADLEAFASITKHIAQESEMHVSYCNSWGISTEELLNTIESPNNIAYTRYLTDVGHSGTLLDLLVAVASCLLGYGEIGRKLKIALDKNATNVNNSNNPYLKWIDDYSGKDFQDAVHEGISTLERKAQEEQLSVDRLNHLSHIFNRCCTLESNFWQMGLDKS